MNIVQKFEYYPGSKEEKLPNFSKAFPYVASRAELDHYVGKRVPWHWHLAVELFYIESGTLIYQTPSGQVDFPAGTGGFVNSNVLHATQVVKGTAPTIQLLHVFEPSLIAGFSGSQIDTQYVLPITSHPAIELFKLEPTQPEHAELLELIKQGFQLSPKDFGYEIKVRDNLSRMWLKLFKELQAILNSRVQPEDKNNAKLKAMLVFIHEHYAQKLTVAEIAASAFLSERDCYRIFSHYLKLSPLAYLTDYRLQVACQLLAEGQLSLTDIASVCGFGSSNYFGRVFTKHIGYPPNSYRLKWQNRAKEGQKFESN